MTIIIVIHFVFFSLYCQDLEDGNSLTFAKHEDTVRSSIFGKVEIKRIPRLPARGGMVLMRAAVEKGYVASER